MTWNPKIPGAGYLKTGDETILTDQQVSVNPRGNLTIWKYGFLPEITDITYHSRESWKEMENPDKNYFRAASRGQEFVITNPSSKIVKWAKKLINEHYNHLCSGEKNEN